MHYGIFLVPLISAFIGWFTPWLAIRMLFRPEKALNILGFSFQGIFPRRQKQIAQVMAKLVSEQLFSMDEIEQKISDPTAFEKLMPLIETHIDDFLRVKLAKKMPIVSMFIGDKTITELKTVFMAELEELFPVIMQKYLGNLKEKFDINSIIIEKVENFPLEKLELIVYQGLSKEIRYLGLFSATIGLLIGLVQSLIVWLI